MPVYVLYVCLRFMHKKSEISFAPSPPEPIFYSLGGDGPQLERHCLGRNISLWGLGMRGTEGKGIRESITEELVPIQGFAG